MASYTVVHVKSATLTASTADTVTLTGSYGSCVILNRGTAEISARVDGTAATVDGDENFVIPAGDWLEIPFPSSIPGSGQSVSLISSGTPAYTVTGV